MPKLTIDEWREIERGVAAIDDLDKAIGHMDTVLGNHLEAFGNRIRMAVGQEAVPQFTNVIIGKIVAFALINTTILRREALVKSLADKVETPSAPCGPYPISNIMGLTDIQDPASLAEMVADADGDVPEARLAS